MEDNHRLTSIKNFNQYTIGKTFTIQDLRFCLTAHIMAKDIPLVEKRQFIRMSNHSLNTVLQYYSFREEYNEKEVLSSVANLFKGI